VAKWAQQGLDCKQTTADAMWPRPKPKPPNPYRESLLAPKFARGDRAIARRETLMKFQITGQGWPVGQYLIPTGSIIDASADDHWSLFARGLTIPINATPLDDEAWQSQLRAYPAHRHLLGAGPPTNKTEET
jgi:hypothetical protein